MCLRLYLRQRLRLRLRLRLCLRLCLRLRSCRQTLCGPAPGARGSSPRPRVRTRPTGGPARCPTCGRTGRAGSSPRLPHASRLGSGRRASRAVRARRPGRSPGRRLRRRRRPRRRPLRNGRSGGPRQRIPECWLHSHRPPAAPAVPLLVARLLRCRSARRCFSPRLPGRLRLRSYLRLWLRPYLWLWLCLCLYLWLWLWLWQVLLLGRARLGRDECS